MIQASPWCGPEILHESPSGLVQILPGLIRWRCPEDSDDSEYWTWTAFQWDDSMFTTAEERPTGPVLKVVCATSGYTIGMARGAAVVELQQAIAWAAARHHVGQYDPADQGSDVVAGLSPSA